MSPRPPSDRARSGFLAGGHAVTVTREEHHHEVLRRHAVGPTTAELGFCTIGSGRYRGRRAIEVRLAGARVGELTFRMSERYAGLVRSVQRALEDTLLQWPPHVRIVASKSRSQPDPGRRIGAGRGTEAQHH